MRLAPAFDPVQFACFVISLTRRMSELFTRTHFMAQTGTTSLIQIFIKVSAVTSPTPCDGEGVLSLVVRVIRLGS